MLKGFRFGVVMALTISLSGQVGEAAAHQVATGEPALTVFLVRHSEKEPGREPGLTPEGKARARSLAQLLSSVQLDAVYATDYRRTRQTAKPSADQQGLPVSLYPPGKLKQFAEQLKMRGGQVLVVGHSNTTPQLVSLLGGEAGEPFDEKREFDRLYLLQGDPSGQISTVVLRYGSPGHYK